MPTQTIYFQLKVISPLHIGCDEVYEPTSFVINETQKELIAFQPADFLRRLDESERKQFSTICQKGTIGSLLEIYKFIRHHAKNAQGECVAVSASLVEHYQTTMNLPANERRIQQELNNFLINRTSFLPLTNMPYVPGSAIKGAIRTAILNLRNQGRNQPYFSGRNASRDLQEHLLAFQFNKLETDPFRLVKVSDFMPVAHANRRVAYAVDFKKRPSDKEPRALAQILETVEPEAEFIGSITIVTPETRAGIKKPIDMAEIRAALTYFYGSENNRENSELKAINVTGAPMPTGTTSYPIRIGRHSGAESVTVNGYRKIKIMKRNKPENQATTIWLSAESKKSSNVNSLKPFGWASLMEISEDEWCKLGKVGEELTAQRLTRLQERAEQEEKSRVLRQAKLAEERAARKAAEQERLRQEEDERLHPWRKTALPIIQTVSDYGQLLQAMEHTEVVQYQSEKEVAQALLEAADLVRDKHTKKWDAERDQKISEWLKPSGIIWVSSIAATSSSAESSLLPEEQAAVEQIKAIADWGAFKNAGLNLAELPRAALQSLRNRMKKDWNCAGNKAKSDKKKALKEVNQLLAKNAA